MTNQQPPELPNNNQQPSLTSKVFQIVKKPQTQIIAGVTVIAIAVAGYFGTRYIVKQILPIKVEKKLEKWLGRDVIIGEITEFSFNKLKVENTTIPTRAIDASYLEIDDINIDFNLLSIFSEGYVPITVVVNDVNGYIQLDTVLKKETPETEKKPLPNTLKLPSLSITADINLKLENVDLAVTPKAEITPLNVKTQGDLHLLYDQENQPLDYQLFTQIEDDNGQINLKGQTSLTTTAGKTQVNLTNLNAMRIVKLIPQLPIKLQTGEINANLTVSIPSIRDWYLTSADGGMTVTNVKGNIDLDKLPNQKEAKKIKALQQPLTAEAYLRFQGRNLNIESATANLGNLGGEVIGAVGVDEGYNLQANLKQLQIGTVLPTLAISLPFKVDGLVNSQINVTGKFDNPQIKGQLKIDNTIVDKVDLGKIVGNFSGNLDAVMLDKLEVNPQAGGKVLAMGLIETNLRDKIKTKEKLDISQLPLQFKFTADLPTSDLIAPYQILPPEISIGDIQAKGEIKGKLNQPTAFLNWQIPSTQTARMGEISGKGELTVANNKINLTNTRLIANDGTILANGNGDLKTKDFSANLVTNDITLTPFVAQFCRKSNQCPDDKLNLNRPIIAKTVDVDVKGKFDNLALDTITANGDINLNINGGEVAVNSNLKEGNLDAVARVKEIPLDSFLVNPNTSITLVNSDINIRGDISELMMTETGIGIPPSLNVNANSQIKVGNGLVNALANLNNQNTIVNADINTLQLDSLFSSLPVTNINNTSVNASIKTPQLLSYLQQINNSNYCQSNVNCLNTLNLDSKINGDIGQGEINATATINNGKVKVDGFTNGINAQEVIPTFPVKANNINSQIKLNANLSDLIVTGASYLNDKIIILPPSLNLIADTNLDVAKGKVDLITNLNHNQWQTDINTRQVNLENLAQQLGIQTTSNNLVTCQSQIKLRQTGEAGEAGEAEGGDVNQQNCVNKPLDITNTIANLPPLDSQIKLSGSLTSLLQSSPSANINIQSANLQLGENNINAKGNVNLINLLTQPDIANLNLDVKADSDLKIIPVNSIIANLPKTQGINLIPDSTNLSGKANFQGNITANNLLTNPLGNDNLKLDGNLTLTNLIFNDLEFEPVLTGKVNINPSSTSIINLQGSQDVIVAEIVKNTSYPDIKLPYLPNNILIRKTDSPHNFLVEGKRNGKQFIATVNNFNLDSLNVSPLANYGLVGKLTGNVETEVAINLTDFKGNGKLKLTEVGIGKIIADELTADINYIGDIVELNSAAIKFRETSYDLQGKLNLATQDIYAKLDLAGDVKDIFDTLQISDISTITALLNQIKTQDYFANASDIPSQSLGKENDSIKNQVNLLYVIDEQIKALAKKISDGTIPDDLEVTGKYEGEILIGGKLTNPTASIDFQGNEWQWLPQQDFPNIVDSLGLIMEDTQSIAIPKIALKADLQNQQLTIQPFQLNIGSSEIYFAGDLSLNKQEGEFKVSNFSLDLVRNFFSSPVDVEGNINIEGKIAGNYQNPQIDGKIDINNASLEGAIIEDKISADFNYQDYQLNANTTFPKDIQVNATLPYHPLVKVDKPANINVNLNTEAIALLGVLTKGQIQLTGGEATANLTVKTDSIQGLINNLDFKNFELDNLLTQVDIQGKVDLNEAEFKSIALPEPIYLTGNAELLGNQQAIKVNNIQAKIKESEINIAGILPLIKPLTNNNNPLTINIPSQNLEIESLYSGKTEADIKIKGTVLNPKISGYVALNKGNVKLLSQQPVKSVEYSNLWDQWIGEVSKKTTGIFQPEIENFEVKLDNLQLAQWNLYRFRFNGDINVSGPVLDLQNLRAEGDINLTRGEIYLNGATPVTGLSGISQTILYLSRRNDNQITFNKNDSILNPSVDILVEADVTDYSRELPTTQNNEIPEPIIRSGQGETVKVELSIDGELQQLLPALAGNLNKFCVINVDKPIPDTTGISEEKLNQVAKCANLSALNAEGSNLGLLNSPLVELSSTPTRGEGELINLLVGGQLINLAEQLQDLSGEQLFETGFVQFVLVPLANRVGFGVNETVSSWGQPLGMDDLRVFPLVEGVYKVQEKSNVSVSYDYIYGEFQVRYQMRF